MILNRDEILKLISEEKLKISPFYDDSVRENGIDLRVGRGIARLKNINNVLDPVKDDINTYYEFQEDASYVIKPDELVLIHTLEYIELPNNVVGLINLRSSYARLGLTIPPTVVDAGFKGELTIQMRGGSFPIKIRVGDRLIHLILIWAKEVRHGYRGKYTGQRGITLPIFKEDL